jgi:uncharacterized membrane protein YfcA
MFQTITSLCPLLQHLAPDHVSALPLLVLIYGTAALFGGLAGFGFSAIGSLSLLALPPQMGIALLMVLSIVTQAISYHSLLPELRAARTKQPLWREGVTPYLLGACLGLPVGLAILEGVGTPTLLLSLGCFLVSYAAWSLFKPDSIRLNAPTSSVWPGVLVGAAGGVIGGFSAFPGAALVVWHGLTGASKAHSRSLTGPFILGTQVVAFAAMALAWPERLSAGFWTLLGLALPIALLGNRAGLALYRRTGDRGYRQITLFVLGLSGAGLVMKSALA